MEQDRLQFIYYCIADNEYNFFVRANDIRTAIDIAENYFEKEYYRPTTFVCTKAKEQHLDFFLREGCVNM